MKIEGYVVKIIKKIEKEGYQAYFVGASVLKHILGKPVEEYDIITSAPFFSLSKAQKEYEGKVHLLEYSKPIHISFLLSKEDFYKKCCYRIDTILYHHKHGIIDDYHGLDDIEKKKLTVFSWKNLESNPLFLLDALEKKASLNFSFDNKLKNYISSYQKGFPKVLDKRIGLYLTRFFLFEQPGKFFMEFEHIFSFFFPICTFRMKVLDYTINNLILRLASIWNDEDLLECEEFLKRYSFPKEIRVEVITILEGKKFIKDENQLEGLIHIVEEESIKLVFSLIRAESLASDQFFKIPILDGLEKKTLALKEYPILSLKDLDISIKDLEDLGYRKDQIPIVLNALFQLVRKRRIENRRKQLQNAATTFLQKNDLF